MVTIGPSNAALAVACTTMEVESADQSACRTEIQEAEREHDEAAARQAEALKHARDAEEAAREHDDSGGFWDDVKDVAEVGAIAASAVATGGASLVIVGAGLAAEGIASQMDDGSMKTALQVGGGIAIAVGASAGGGGAIVAGAGIIGGGATAMSAVEHGQAGLARADEKRADADGTAAHAASDSADRKREDAVDRLTSSVQTLNKERAEAADMVTTLHEAKMRYLASMGSRS